jgi:hypothetical protein
MHGFQVGAFGKYNGPVYDHGFLSDDGEPYRIDGQFTANLYVQYRFRHGALKGSRFRIGARNITNEKPPISAGGYYGALYQPYGRYLYASFGFSL